jgi:hypothetical protein
VAEALTETAEERPWDQSAMSASPFWYLRRGEYARQLEPWSHVFERVEVVVFERLTQDPGEIRRLYRKLGVDSDFSPPDHGRVNTGPGEAISLDVSTLHRLQERFAPANARLESIFGVDLTQWRHVER